MLVLKEFCWLEIIFENSKWLVTANHVILLQNIHHFLSEEELSEHSIKELAASYIL